MNVYCPLPNYILEINNPTEMRTPRLRGVLLITIAIYLRCFRGIIFLLTSHGPSMSFADLKICHPSDYRYYIADLIIRYPIGYRY